jgi:hypothetical protein
MVNIKGIDVTVYKACHAYRLYNLEPNDYEVVETCEMLRL